ncbi:MAG: hypothetical protein PHI62_02560 [Candidatus Methanomethylophilaceae archaeon]|nr:hypothetical protein [Candidatus Methanomethylophilaceae archaeon]
MAQEDYNRPILLTIIAILSIIFGIITILLGVLMLIGSAVISTAELEAGLFAGAGSAVVLIMGILFTVVGFGLMSGKSWAWWLSIIVMVLNLILGLLTLDIISIVIAALILIYLTRPNTKGWFGIGS